MVMLFQPIKKLGGLNAYFQEAAVGVGQLEKVFATEPTVREGAEARELRPINEALRLEGVTFAYDGEPVLIGVDLELTKGMRLGIAGESGAGGWYGSSFGFRSAVLGLGDGIDWRVGSLAP